MKKNLWKFGLLSLATVMFVGCEQDVTLEELDPDRDGNLVTGMTCDVINFEDAATTGFISEVSSIKGWGPVLVNNQARNASGEMEGGNRAMVFNTEAPTGDDEDLYTTDWGKALIIQELGVDNEPNDNRWGGEMTLTFPTAVTLESMKALDIDEYEDNSWVYLYDASGAELFKVQLQALGNNSKQTVSLGNTKGVTKMKIVLAGTQDHVGSGAIDDIMFCVEEKEEEPQLQCDVINFENGSTNGYVTEVASMNGWGPVLVKNTARNASGDMEGGNRAMLFDTGAPTGDDDDLYTTDWGKALIIQELGIENEPNDNRWGGEMMLTFPKAVKLESMKVLDIDEYEDNSWVYLYDGAGNELHKVKLQPLGDNSQQTVDLGGTAGVMMLKVVLAGNEGFVGSGAIDDIMFCETTVVPPVYENKGCTRTQGYWKNHADPTKKQYDATWNEYLNKTFYNSGMNYLKVLNTSPKGDAYIILAHQYIAAELNVAAGASIPQDVLNAWNAATAYFKGDTTPGRSELLTWAELLDDYNNGVVGPGHCE